jgi:hypothetical protein
MVGYWITRVQTKSLSYRHDRAAVFRDGIEGRLIDVQVRPD